ncbi:hypothetical protein QF036_002882 [Arthrobacter globiformis]|nr:hypothetical protein [Arthrobacter globiformis]
MISAQVVLILIIIVGALMMVPLAIFDSRHPRQEGETLGSRRIALISLAFTGIILDVGLSAAMISMLSSGK